MISLHRIASPALVAFLVAISVAACAGGAGTRPSGAGVAGSDGPGVPPVPTATVETEAPNDVPGSLGPRTATACLTLGVQDCERAREMAASVLVGGDPAARYVQVGPFGCAAGDVCPATLAARPEGDVVIEFDGGEGINVHLTAAPDGTFEAVREAAMGVAVEATSPSGIPVGPVPFTLGHCGVFSGIDVDGSWWDPVGPVSMDSGEAVNATAGILTVTDPNHAAFTTPTGFAVQLERRAGPKLLPFCM